MIRSLNGKTPRIARSAYIDEAAHVIGDVEIGEDSSVFPGAVIRADMGSIRLGSQVIVEDNCVIHSGAPRSPVGDVVIGDKVIIGHGAVLNCKEIGSHVLIGIKAAILHEAVVGDYCIIAACALVGPGMRVPNRSLVVGVPGKIAGAPTEEQLWWVEEGVENYRKHMKMYSQEG